MLDSKNKIQNHFNSLTKPYSFNSNRFFFGGLEIEKKPHLFI